MSTRTKIPMVKIFVNGVQNAVQNYSNLKQKEEEHTSCS